MSNLLKVENHDGLYRDTETNAIINNDKDSYNQYINRRNKQKARDDGFFKQQEEIDSIKRDVSEIKQLLMELLRR